MPMAMAGSMDHEIIIDHWIEKWKSVDLCFDTNDGWF
jgi:hypothetical protein